MLIYGKIAKRTSKTIETTTGKLNSSYDNDNDNNNNNNNNIIIMIVIIIIIRHR